MDKRDEEDPGKIAAVIDNRDGTYTVLRCASKEHPQGFRRIIGRFTGFTTKGKALDRAELIEGRSHSHGLI